MKTNFTKTWNGLAVLLLLAVLVLTVRPATAKGPFDLLVMEVNGTSLEITQPELMDFFSFSYFPENRIEVPPAPGEGYLITRYAEAQGGDPRPFDQLRYYPSRDGSGGYVYYVGIVEGSSEYDQKWYQGSPEAEATLKEVVTPDESGMGRLIPVAMLAFLGLVFLVLRDAR